MITLYLAPGTCALASHIALEEVGAQYETVRLDFAKREQADPAYLAVNPKGRVPALATERGVLTETPAILAYIAQMYPDAGLAPASDPFAFAELQAFNIYLCATVHIAHAHRLRGRRWADDEASIEDMKRVVPRTMTACFDLIETKLIRGPWVMGDAYTVCDPYLFTLTRWLDGDGVDRKIFPRVSAHYDAMTARPAVQRALAAHAA